MIYYHAKNDLHIIDILKIQMIPETRDPWIRSLVKIPSVKIVQSRCIYSYGKYFQKEKAYLGFNYH